MSKRYIVVPKSESAHCCFEATVLDTQTIEFKTEDVTYFKNVCETFEIEDAEKIATLLNGA